MSERGVKPIVIVGAGIGGLALAAALQRRGRSAVVFEERDQLTTTGSGISLWPNALAALDDIGLGRQVREAGGGAASGAIRRPDGRRLRTIDRTRAEAALGEPLIAIHRAALLGVLSSAVDPAAIHLASAVRRVETAELAVTLADGSSVAAAAVVGADGVRSVVARQLGSHRAPRYAGYTAWRGVAGVSLADTEPGETWGPSSEFGFMPLGAHGTYWFATERGPEGGRAPTGELAYLARRFASWHAPIGELLASTDPEVVLRHDIYDRHLPERWSVGQVTLIGDAAHPMRPHLGQGGCQALQDAAVLARLITYGGPIASAFARYESMRRPVVRRIVRESAAIGRAIHCRPPLGPALHRMTTLVPDSVVLTHMETFAGRRGYLSPDTP
ncbi:MAG: FAD-dependent monooxygenase [Sciscionella sp.]